MPENITAIYENGCLHPLHPIDLKENETVQVMIFPQKQADAKDDIVQIMVSAGLVHPSRTIKASLPPDPVSEEERDSLAEKLGKAPGNMLSEIIVSEREQ